MHLLLDAKCKFGMNGCREVSDFMMDVINVTGLHLRHLHVQEFYTGEPSGPGISGIALLSESHLNVHTWPERQTIQMCLHSCNDFDPERVKKLLYQRLGVKEILAEYHFDRSMAEVSNAS